MHSLTAWLADNYQWLFSGAGVTLLLVIGGLFARRRSRSKLIQEEPIERLNVHIQPASLVVHNEYEDYDAVLGIYISNASDRNVTITRASFEPQPTHFGIRRRTKLPIYPSAFRDRRTGRYELKFGNEWRDFGVTIPRGQRAFTYLPLSKAITSTDLQHKQNGAILLEYETPNGSRLHSVKV